MQIRYETQRLALRNPFTIARGSRTYAETVVVCGEHDGIVGLGETSPIARYGESVETVLNYFKTHLVENHNPFEIEEMLAKSPAAARCALDVSLHDWTAKRLGVPLYEYLGLNPGDTPITSYTIGIDSLDVMIEKVESAKQHAIIKVKLGTHQDVEIIEAIRSRFTGTLRIDANEGWTAEETVKNLRDMKRFDIELCEQPIPAGRPEQLRWVRDRVATPIVADEDAKNARDIFSLKDCVDGVNVKLVKSGGIRGAIDMIRAARALGMRVMIGCMLESSILATAAAHLTPLADWADIDGPLLLADDPFIGVGYKKGKLMLPTLPGLGVAIRSQSVVS